MSRFVPRVLGALLLICSATFVCAETAAFDLRGPKIDVRVDRGGKGLPIGEVPNLLPGDRLWIHPDLPETQSTHYLLVVAFLRGATNPPPESWFTKVETWNKDVRQEGVMIKVPDEAQQALLFLAPSTGGDFTTLRATVRGKPGAFVRAAQDLQQASLDHARLEKYLALVREASREDAADKRSVNLLARSLNIKVDQQCFEQPVAQQLQCLTKNSDQLVLDDAHSQSMVATLTSGASADLLTQITNTPHAGGGSYSPYVGAVVDVVRILASAHSAKYQYIPALAVPSGETLNLKLNNPPSFRDPKSVIVVGLPPIGHVAAPPLRLADDKQVLCAEKPDLVLPADGAPLIFGTELGHDFTLNLKTTSGEPVSLPATPSPSVGGFVVDTGKLRPGQLAQNVNAMLRGAWGFESFEGPTYHLRSSQPTNWVVGSADASALIVGRDDMLHLKSEQAVCVKEVSITAEDKKRYPTEWKAAKPDLLEVKIALQDAAPGPLTMEVTKYGASEPDIVPLHSYAEAARLGEFAIHAGDSAGTLSGTRLDQVAELQVNGVRFTPGDLSRANQQDQLAMKAAQNAEAAKLIAVQNAKARVMLKDGRVLETTANITAARPVVSLLGKTVSAGDAAPAISLDSTQDMPQDGVLRFALKSVVPERFSPVEKVEVATADEMFHVTLSTADNNLTLQDAQTVLAILEPLKHLGPSAFGPLKFRAVAQNGVAGDWQPLVTLVRVPTLSEVHCANTPEKQCTLTGQKLFLLDSVSSDPQFSNAVKVPEGFVNTTLAIPPLNGKVLYLKLRDDPSIVSTATVPVINGPKSPVTKKSVSAASPTE